MKYSEKNKPLVCMMTNSTCYKGTTTFTPKGILWHSTGCNNTTIKRYVQPSDNAPDREEMLDIIGVNKAKNDWNHKKVQAGLNCWIGTLADGSIATVQTMPWNYKPWGCGSGSKGSCNNTHIQFEICEDSLTNKDYFNKVYKEACEITAYLCKMYNINPYGYIVYNNVRVPTIICHADSYKLGMGSNHGDVLHWFKKYGKTMDDVRRDVATLMGITSSDSVEDSYMELMKGDKGTSVKELQQKLIKLGYSCGTCGADGDFGNATLNAVKKFQKDHSLTASGVVDADTRKAIEKALEALDNKQETTKPSTPNTSTTTTFKDGDVIKLAAGATYVGGKSIPTWVKNSTLYYRGVRTNGDIIISVLKTGAITGAVPAKYIVGAQSVTSTTPSTSTNTAKTPYIVRTTVSSLNIRKGPGSNHAVIGTAKSGSYTIVEESNGWGLLKAYAKTRGGWISLEYTKKV